MAALNLTTSDKIDALTDRLWKATQEEVPQIVARLLGTISHDEMACVWYIHSMMTLDTEDHLLVDTLTDEWANDEPLLDLSNEVGRELATLADILMEKLCPYSC